MTAINQKEYLKKYLGLGKAPGEKKKKRKKEKQYGNRLKIVDDDIEASISQEIQDDLSAANEDAPLVVAVIDERPPSLRIDDVTKNNLWQPIGEPVDSIEDVNKLKLASSFKLAKSNKDTRITRTEFKKPGNRGNSNTSLSKATDNHEHYRNLSPPRNKVPVKTERYSEDSSPPRQRKKLDIDCSPPRRNKQTERSKKYEDTLKTTADDMSPPRKKSCIKSERDDNSPPRRKIRERDDNSSRHHKSHKHNDNSPPRQRKLSPPARKNSTSDHRHKKKSRWASPDRLNDTPEKVNVTLSGKKAGLQNAKDITQEITTLREKEDKMFNNMSEEVSGFNAATIVRDRKPRDLEEEARQLEKQKETQEKYDRWGKGLKQVQDQSEKMAEQLYEMSKPLARYADDEDLDKYLKEQEREGDPMLAYIRKKKKKKAVEAGVPEKPTYMGEFMPNRFGIIPGYRWDGVDRSNGYEKKWFEVQNKKKANLEEAHKWSTEDM